MMMYSLLILCSFMTTTNAQEMSDEKYHTLPIFTELDDYDKCMSMKNAFYCFGTFRIHSIGSDREYFDFIQEYSNITHHYDRTYFHRGYCMSSKCPSYPKTTDGFQSCVQASYRELNVSAVQYFCQSPKNTAKVDGLVYCFLMVVSILLILNIVGTIKDVKNMSTENTFWTSWSIKSNWQQLIAPFGDDPNTMALAPIQGIRVIMMMLIIIVHILTLYGEAYLYNPSFIEYLLITPLKVWGIKSSSLVQVFLAVSSFLTAYNLLTSKKQLISFRMLPKQIIRRYFRIAPVHLFFIGFGATLWPLISDGPMWSKIHKEAATCRKQFWFHLLHINNLKGSWGHCLPQAWSLAVDIQFQIVSLILTIYLSQYYRVKFKILTILLILSCLLNTVLAYINNWKPLMYTNNGKTLVTMSMDTVSFGPYYYISPWGSLPSCVMGLIMAHLYFDWRQGSFKLTELEWLVYLSRYSLPLLILWIFGGQFTQNIESPIILAVYLGLERPVFCGLACIWIFSVIVGEDGFTKSFLAWQGWLPLGRLSLSVLMLHWVIILTNFSYRPQPVFMSYFSIILDCLSTWCFSYMMAIPVTLLIELPLINTYNHFSAKNIKTIGLEAKKL